MKLFDKVKNIFTEEVEEEVKVEKVSTSGKREKKPEVVDSFEEVKIEKEEVVKKPVFFTDHDFEDLEQKQVFKKESNVPLKENVREDFNSRNYNNKYTEKRLDSYSKLNSNPDIYKGNQTTIYNDPYKEKKEERIFKPTPIISPVYGILDKNYHKEDIVSKKEVNYSSVGEVTNIDTVRQKAYGTLEDELENTLFGSNSILFNNKIDEKNKENDEFFNELEKETIPDLSNNYGDSFENEEHEKKIKDLEEITMDIGKELNLLLNKKENIKNHEEKKPSKDEVDEDDLFDLIDTMYEGDE